MPNWISDEDLSLESGDSWRCEHCGKVNSTEIGINLCGCKESHEAWEKERQASEQAEAKRKASGKIRKEITLVIECYNTERDINNVLRDFSTWWEQGGNSDDILEFMWKVTNIKDL